MLRRLGSCVRNQWMGAVALFFVLAGGTAYAVDTVGSEDIINNSVAGVDIKNEDIRAVDVRDASRPNGGLSGLEIVDESLSSPDISKLSADDLTTAAQTSLLPSGAHRTANGGTAITATSPATQFVPVGTLPAGPHHISMTAGLELQESCAGPCGVSTRRWAEGFCQIAIKPGTTAFGIAVGRDFSLPHNAPTDAPLQGKVGFSDAAMPNEPSPVPVGLLCTRFDLGSAAGPGAVTVRNPSVTAVELSAAEDMVAP